MNGANLSDELCVVCGGETGRRRVGATPMRVCRRCGVGRAETDGPAVDYWTSRGGAEESNHYWTEARTSVFKGALQLLAAETRGRRLLDLGGGVGHFAACALEAGWDAYSADVSEVAVAAAAARLGPERSLRDVPPPLTGSFDAVTLWCVVAHTTDAKALLGAAARALRPGGTIFLTTPNFRFQQWYVAALGRLDRPVDLRHHDHVLHFSTAGIGRALADAGVREHRFVYVGVTEECVAEPRLKSVLVPAKRVWNRLAITGAKAGLPLLSSELQVLGTVG